MTKLIIIFSIFLLSCGNKASKTSLKLPDTTKTVALYILPDNTGGLRLDYVFRIIKDSIKYSQVDEQTQKRMKTIDTTYYVPVFFNLLDTLDKTGNKFLLDSLGQPKTTVQLIPTTTKNIIQDFNKKYN